MDPYAFGTEGLTRLLGDEPAYRAAQVQRWLVRGVGDPSEMTDLPAAVRERLAAAFDPPPSLLRHTTADGGLTHKVLLEVGGAPGVPEAAGAPEVRQDPEAGVQRPAGSRAEAIESVLMLYPAGAGGGRGQSRRETGGERGQSRARATVCVSTQAGCALGCPFCATGQAGFRRQLGLGEIVSQVTVVQRLLETGVIRVPGTPDHVTNVVFMGMGEPLANLEETVAAVRWLTDPDGFRLSARSVTVSTVGLVPGIRRLAELGSPITLALSLHAPNDALRDDLVPVNRRWPLRELIRACVDYQEATRRRMTVEYILIDGVNADVGHARELAEVVRELGGRGGPVPHVNLIPMNPTPAVPWRAPPAGEQAAFAGVLERAGVPATVRRNRGTDIDAACGQLYADYAAGSGRRLPAAAGAAQRVAAAGGRR